MWLNNHVNLWEEEVWSLGRGTPYLRWEDLCGYCLENIFQNDYRNVGLVSSFSREWQRWKPSCCIGLMFESQSFKSRLVVSCASVLLLSFSVRRSEDNHTSCHRRAQSHWCESAANSFTLTLPTWQNNCSNPLQGCQRSLTFHLYQQMDGDKVIWGQIKRRWKQSANMIWFAIKTMASVFCD